MPKYLHRMSVDQFKEMIQSYDLEKLKKLNFDYGPEFALIGSREDNADQELQTLNNKRALLVARLGALQAEIAQYKANRICELRIINEQLNITINASVTIGMAPPSPAPMPRYL